MSTAQKRFFEKHSIGSSPKMPVRCLLPILKFERTEACSDSMPKSTMRLPFALFPSNRFGFFPIQTVILLD